MENNNEKITLVNDEGLEIEFDVVAGINYNEEFYLIMCPNNLEDVEDDEAFVFKYIEYEDGDVEYEYVDDDETLDAVFKIYEELIEEEEN